MAFPTLSNRLEGILAQSVPFGWLPSVAAGMGFPDESHWK
jgi:hypothetical protein